MSFTIRPPPDRDTGRVPATTVAADFNPRPMSSKRRMKFSHGVNANFSGYFQIGTNLNCANNEDRRPEYECQ